MNIDLPDNKLSVLKYIYRNTPTNSSSPVTKLIHFCENMLWYRSLSEGNSHMGFTTRNFELTEMIRENNKLEEFQYFLKQNGLNYQLGFEKENDGYILYAYYRSEERTEKALFYLWHQPERRHCSSTLPGASQLFLRSLFCLLMSLMLFSTMNLRS